MDKMSPPRSRGLRLLLAALVTSLAIGAAGMVSQVRASDHDDGETNIKSRNLGLTDLYVFREDWQTGNAADAGELSMIMCTNPRSMPRQQYFFNTNARYNFHVGRQASRDSAVTGKEDYRFEFTFGKPDANSRQAITLTAYSFDASGQASSQTVSAGFTTPAPILLGNQAPSINNVTINNQTFEVFAGLREDPFFFDVDAFFRTRAFLAGGQGAASPNPFFPPGFAPDANTSKDFAVGFNVNAIVMDVPIAFLRSAGGAETVFDVWTTISLPSNIAALQN